MLAGLWTGARHERTWHGDEPRVDFYDVKGVVEAVCSGLKVAGVRFFPLTASSYPYLKPERTAEIREGDACLGAVGELSKGVLENFGLKQAAFAFELNFDELMPRVREELRVKTLPRFPATARDLAMIVSDGVEAQSVLDFLEGLGQPLIERVEIFDVYKGKPIPQGKKSLALRFTYRSSERNLTDNEVNAIHETVIQQTLAQFKGQLPASSSTD